MLREWHTAYKYAKYSKHKELAEDFAQYYCLRILEGRSAYLPGNFVDYMRETFGDSRNISFLRESKVGYEYLNQIEDDRNDIQDYEVANLVNLFSHYRLVLPLIHFQYETSYQSVHESKIYNQ